VVSEFERRIAIKALWVAAGKPPAAEWEGSDGVAGRIANELSPCVLSATGGVRVVLSVLRECALADAQGDDYFGGRKPGSGGHNKKMDVARTWLWRLVLLPSTRV
jgi:hypothetical protein